MARPARYRKRPVMIEALRWTGDMTAMTDFAGDRVWPDRADPAGLIVASLEGDVRCPPGHWVLRGIRREFYVCDPAIFAATHVFVTETHDDA